MPDLDFTGLNPADYIDATWDDQNGKPWRAHANGMWYEYVEPVTGGVGTFAELTDAATASIATTNTSVADALAGKQPLAAVLTGTTASFTTALASKLDGIEAGATGDQDLSGLLTIATAASTYAPISTAVTLTGTQTLTNKSISSGQITGLGALATVTPGTNVATALAINADATGGIFRQGQALSGTTGTFSGAITAGTGKILSASAIQARNSTDTGYQQFQASAIIAEGGVIQNQLSGRWNNGGKFDFGTVCNLAWSSSATWGGTSNVNISYVSSGVLGIGSGAVGSTAGSLSLTNLTASGTVTAAQYLYTAALFVTESTTARTLTSADHGKTIVCTNAGAVAITLNTGLPTCFFVTIIQKGTGQVTVSGSATLEVFTGFAAKTAGQHAQMSVSNYGTSNVYHIAGQLGT